MAACRYYFVFVIIQLLNVTTLTQVTVNTTLGKILGDKASKSSNVLQFFNIPFAEPPTGSRRWRKPLDKLPWTDTLDARNDGTMGKSCMQVTSSSRNYNVTEDCLYLNVYTTGTIGKKAVMFWIHGGGHNRGTALEYDGTLLAEKGVVVVTTNYRLGVFGNFDYNADGKWDNLAMWDILAALKWVKKNIAAFGGDKDRVTVFGGSAGAMLSTLIAMSPEFEGLLHRIIAESGSALCPKMIDRDPQAIYNKVLRATDCSNTECLMQMNSAALLTATKTMATKYEDLVFPVKYSFAPYTDDEMIKADPFQVFKSYRDGQGVTESRRMSIITRFQKYDMMIGYNTVEGSLILSQLDKLAKQNGHGIEEGADNRTVHLFLDEYVREYFPRNFKRIKADIINRYFRTPLSREPTIQQGQGLLNVFTDLLFASTSLELADAHSNHNPSLTKQGSTYLYTFSHETQDSQKQNPIWFRGSRHTDERTFIFGKHPTFYHLDNYNMTREEELLKETMMTAWSNFAKTGSPNSGSFKLIWKPYSTSRQYFMTFGASQYDVLERLTNTRKSQFLKDVRLASDFTTTSTTTPTSTERNAAAVQTLPSIGILILITCFVYLRY